MFLKITNNDGVHQSGQQAGGPPDQVYSSTPMMQPWQGPEVPLGQDSFGELELDLDVDCDGDSFGDGEVA